MTSSEVKRQPLRSETNTFTLYQYRQFARHLPGSNLRILDCGCNTGRSGTILRQILQNAELYSIVLAPERIEQISSGIYQRTVEISAADLPFDDGFFDAIVVSEFIEHVGDPDLLATFYEFQRVLKPGGKILLTTPNPNAYLVRMSRSPIFDAPSHVNIMSPRQLKKKLSSCDFNLSNVVGSSKASRYFGEQFPLFNVYGSYLAIVTH